jgi:hypothetical protein
MGDIRFRRLEQRGGRRSGDNIELSMSLPRTASGMEARRCPNDACTPRLFRLGDVESATADGGGTDPRQHRTPHTAGTSCPYCGHVSSDDHDFIDPDDIEAMTEWFKWAAGEDALDAVGEMFKNVGRGLPRGGPVSIEVDTQRRSRPEPLLWREDLLRNLTCNVCARQYGVYAIGLFCPDCGVPNLAVHFARECALIEQQIELARAAESAELGFRLLGNAHEDVVTALETYLKTVYRYLAMKRLPEAEARKLVAQRAIGNAFQNVERSQQRFVLFTIDPFASLNEDDLDVFQQNIEKRHVLGHNLGLADEKYAEVVSGEQPGRTVVLLADEVARFAELASRVVAQLELAAFPASPTLS